MSDPQPLISIFTVVKNGAKTIRRCLDSVLALDYPNFEHVIQDGLSTDGTLEILADYARRNPNVIRLVSDADSCAEEGFYRGLKRCRGKYIGSCLADEALLPQAAKWAAAAFELHPSAGAVYGDLFITDEAGNIQSEFKAPHPFSLEKYLLHEVNPPFASSFFRREALEDIGLQTFRWTYDMGEFELWVRLSAKHAVEYRPGVVATYAVCPGQRSCRKDILLKLFDVRREYLPRLFKEPDIQNRFGPVFQQAMGGLHLFVAEVLRDSGSYAEAAELLRKSMPFRPNAEPLKRVLHGFFNQGATLAEQRRPAEAVLCWEPLIELGIDIPQMAELKRQLAKPSDHYSIWQAGVPSEVRFWREWLGKLAQDHSITDRLDPAKPLQPTLCQLLEKSHPETSDTPLEILDIGSGPLTSLGKAWSRQAIRVSAADPLAVHYNQALDEGKIVPPVRVVEAQAEKLTTVFKKSSFDLVTAINCLDHSYDPLQAIMQAVQVVKPGCFVLLANERHEGENEAYSGLHQWNFDVEDGNFVIWSPTRRFNVSDALRPVADVVCEISESREFVDSPDVLLVKIRKHDALATPAPVPPVVSVIVLCHNYAAHLRASVESVIAQTYPAFELIILDDGSNDDSLQIAHGLAKEYGDTVSIRVCHLDDVGPSAARRFGVTQARGRYYVPLDADDKLAATFLEQTVPVLEADPRLGFVYTDSIYFGAKDQRQYHPDYDFARLCVGNYISYCSLVRRAAFEAVDGYDRANWGYYEDWDFWIRMGEAGWFGRHLPEPLFLYHVHPGSSLTFYSLRLDPIYRAHITTEHPAVYGAAAVANARKILADVPPGLLALPPLKDVAQIQKLLLQSPDNRYLLYFLAFAQFRAGNAGDAVTTLNSLISIHPNDNQAREALNNFSLQMLSQPETGELNDSPAVSESAAALATPLLTAEEQLRIRAQTAFAGGDWQNAAEASAKLVNTTPDNVEMLHILATALLKLGAIEDALPIAQHLVALAPHATDYIQLLDTITRATGASSDTVDQASLPESNRPEIRRAATRIVALISAYNEGDVIYHVVGDLIANGVEVYFLDNNSTDNTIAEASKWLGRGLLKIERFPQDAGYSEQCGKEYVWRELLRRKEDLALELGADWYIHADADEFRESPWPGKSLAEAIREVDLLGYNAINFSLFNFRPIDNSFVAGDDVRKYLTAYEPGDWFDSVQIKAWKNPGRRVDIVQSGGHSVSFENRRIFPINFVLRHYPIRNEDHGRRKVFKDRLPRFNQEERAAGWHVQYNSYTENQATFLCDPAKLVSFDGNAVRAELLARASLDMMLASSLANQTPALQQPSPEALFTWLGKRLGMTEPLAPEVGQKASQILDSLLHTQAFGEKKLDLDIDAPLAALLLALNEVNSTYARLRGDSRLALATRSVEKELERLRADATPIESPANSTVTPDRDDFFDAAEVENIERTIAAASANGGDHEAAGQLHSLQEGLMNFLVTADTAKLEGLFRGNFGHVFRALVKWGTAPSATSGKFEDRRFELEKAVSVSAVRSGAFDCRPLLACMLCGPASRNATTVAPEKLPAWLRPDYLNYCGRKPTEPMTSVRVIDTATRNRKKKRRAKPAYV